MLNLSDLAQLPLITKFIEGCLVDSIPAGAVPKDVMIQLPDGDGAKVPARYTGFPPGLVATDEVAVRVMSQDPIRYLITNSSGATAKSGGWPFATIRTVSTTDPDADHATIAAAITAASADDIILLDAETFTENITINVAVTLMSLSPQETTITTAAGDTITVTADNVVLRGLTIDNTRASGTVSCITSGNDGLIMENCVVTKTSGNSTNSYGVRNTGGANWILTDVDVTVSSGATTKYAYRADTAASSVKLVRGSYTGTTEDVLLNHANADLELDNADIAGEISSIAAGVISGKVHDLILVKNSSGFPSDKGEVGYLDEAGEFQFTTTEALNATWCIVEIGNSDGYNMWVRRRGNTTVNYTGADPSAGEFLITSTSLTLAKQQTTMHPAIFAVCTAAGAGGTVAVQLLTGRTKIGITSSNDILNQIGISDTNWITTLNGAPAGAVITYTVPLTAGSEDTIVTLTSNELMKIILWNTTKSPSERALIDSANVGANTITVTDATDISGWLNGEIVTAQSQANFNFGGGAYYYDIEVEDTSVIPLLTTELGLYISISDSGGTSSLVVYHPWEANAAAKQQPFLVQVTGLTFAVASVLLPLIERRLCLRRLASGVSTHSNANRLEYIIVATP